MVEKALAHAKLIYKYVFATYCSYWLRQGGPGMKGSAAYPAGFAKALLALQTEYNQVETLA